MTNFIPRYYDKKRPTLKKNVDVDDLVRFQDSYVTEYEVQSPDTCDNNILLQIV